MENVVTRSKFVNETISIVFDFSDQLSSGETVSSCTIIVSLFSGADPDPSNILYLIPIITGTQVDQKFRLGVPGCIYEINFLAVGSIGTKADKSTNLAILPQDGTAIPSFTVIYETSCLYPYEISEEGLSSNIALIHGLLGYLYAESLQPSITLLSGIVGGAAVNYSMQPEGIDSSILWIAGNINGNSVNYSNPPDSMTSSFLWLSGTIGGTAINYAIPPEAMSSDISWFSGSLT